MRPYHIDVLTSNIFVFYLDHTLRKVTIPVRVILSKEWSTDVYNSANEALLNFARCNAHQAKVRISMINVSDNRSKVVITVGPNEKIFIPEGVDLTLDKLYFHLKDGSIFGIDYEILLLE